MQRKLRRNRVTTWISFPESAGSAGPPRNEMLDTQPAPFPPPLPKSRPQPRAHFRYAIRMLCPGPFVRWRRSRWTAPTAANLFLVFHGSHAFAQNTGGLPFQFAEFGLRLPDSLSLLNLDWRVVPMAFRFPQYVMEHHAQNGSWRIIPQPPTVDLPTTSVCVISPNLAIAEHPRLPLASYAPVPY